MFQSLRGFGVGWSLIWAKEADAELLFQSLRGFGVGWSLRLWWAGAPVYSVSIPERVWGGLERSISIWQRHQT